jgi:LemA protein
MWFLLLLLGVAVIGVLWLVSLYNGLVGLRNQVQNAWKQIDVQLKRRHDLIPNLVETVRGAMRFEQETLERVMAARARAVSAVGVAATGRAEGELTQALGRLFAVMEAYPDLKANQNALALQEELTATENKIAFARQFYNDLVMRFNTTQQSFPANLLAGSMGFQAAEYLEIPDAERAVPKVDLSLGGPPASAPPPAAAAPVPPTTAPPAPTPPPASTPVA